MNFTVICYITIFIKCGNDRKNEYCYPNKDNDVTDKGTLICKKIFFLLVVVAEIKNLYLKNINIRHLNCLNKQK